MSLDYIDTPTEHEFTESIGATTIIGDQFVNPSLFFLNDPFGPNSASGSVLGDVTANPGYLGYPVGDFAVNYQSILPDGAIDTSSGSADGDMFLAMGHPILFGETVFVSFQTVPEPSSMVLAGAALLMTGIFEWMRRFRPRPCSSYNYKSWLRRINPTPQHPAQVIRTGLADEGRYDEPFQGQKRR